ncbi:MAG: hypothetical protein ACJASX_002601 [Limisphaerales bacterium]
MRAELVNPQAFLDADPPDYKRWNWFSLCGPPTARPEHHLGGINAEWFEKTQVIWLWERCFPLPTSTLATLIATLF